MTHGSKGEVQIWNEFHDNWEELAYQSERILAKYKNASIEKAAEIVFEDLPPEGKERESLIKIRVNQSFFRRTILASYDNQCCITGIAIPDLLIASHIIPWSVDEKNRMNPCNGLCLNALHDRAFDKGLITITPDYYTRVSKIISKTEIESLAFITQFADKRITLPQRFLPTKEFIEYHNKYIFNK